MKQHSPQENFLLKYVGERLWGNTFWSIFLVNMARQLRKCSRKMIDNNESEWLCWRCSCVKSGDGCDHAACLFQKMVPAVSSV